MMEVIIPRERLNASNRRMLADGAMPAGTQKMRIVIDPDAADRINPNMTFTVTVYGPGNVVIHTSTVHGQPSATNPEGEPFWPWETTFAMLPGQPWKAHLDCGPDRALRSEMRVQALMDGDV